MKPSLQLVITLFLTASLFNTPILGMKKIGNFLRAKKQRKPNKIIFEAVRDCDVAE